MIYNIQMKLENLFENPQAAEIFESVLPGMQQTVLSNPNARQLSV